MTTDNPFPQQCVVEVTAACDQACVFCGRTYMERPKKTMKPEVFRAVVEEIGRENPECELWPTFMGEALLLGEKLFELIRYARSVGCRKITLNSNGNRLTERNIEGILSCGIDRFIVSCDGHTPETYEKIRVGGKHERLYEGLHRLLAAVRRRGQDWPLIELQFSVFDENEHERDDFRNYWLDQGVVVKTRPKLYWSGSVEGGQHRVTTGPDRQPCLWALDTAAIHWNGNVVMCAVDCEGKYVAGNVTHQSLGDIWRGPLAWMRRLQKEKRFRELSEVCRKCTDWQVKKAHAFFPDEATRSRYEEYVRRGRSFHEQHELAPSDQTVHFSVDGQLVGNP